MLIELAIGDAYGASFEFAKPAFIAKNNDLKYKTHPSRPHENISKGHYTDDTQMSIGMAEYLIANKGVKPTTERIADYFIKAYTRYPIMGYGSRIKQAMVKASTGIIEMEPPEEPGKTPNTFQKPAKDVHGIDFIDALSTVVSNANGCVMRVLPLGVLSEVDEIIQHAIIQASITHATIDSINAAINLSLAAHYYYHKLYLADDAVEADENGARYSVIPWVSEATQYRLRPVSLWPGAHVPCDGEKTVRAVITLVTEGRSLKQILKTAVSWGGDTDSVAALAVGLASLDDRIEKDLPRCLIRGLENGEYGRGYLADLEDRLFGAFPRRGLTK